VVILDLPFPPSANRLTRHGVRGGKLSSYTNPDYVAWRTEAEGMFMQQKKGCGTPIKGFFTYHIALDKTRWPKASDGDNRAKAVLDFLQAMGLIEDDKFAVSGTWSWAPVKGCLVQVHASLNSELERAPSAIASGRKSKATLVSAG
jgi:Holliday junction resolvase RusA-like endonuclease